MKTKKSLGQNFLKSKGAIAKMVEVSGARKGDMVLEIGPGLGVLTDAILATGANALAVEKDDRLIPILREKFEKEIKSGQLKLIHADILDFDMSKIPFGKNAPRGILDTYKVVANIPYYITGQVIRKFLEVENQPRSMTLLVQKEVAERIVAKDGKESLLSLSVKAYGEPRYIQTVKRGSFTPAPNVDSAIIHIANISREKFQRSNLGDIGLTFKTEDGKNTEISEQKFFELIHAGFAHKRKQLLPNLSVLYSKDALASAFEKCNIPLKSRAEDIPLQNWLKLCKSLFNVFD
jgi:16S rRNA (adenine1518-N6/adenine1519-N6)-dimethyltransferase